MARTKGAKNRTGREILRDAKKEMKLGKLKERLEKEKAKKKSKNRKVD